MTGKPTLDFTGQELVSMAYALRMAYRQLIEVSNSPDIGLRLAVQEHLGRTFADEMETMNGAAEKIETVLKANGLTLTKTSIVIPDNPELN